MDFLPSTSLSLCPLYGIMEGKKLYAAAKLDKPPRSYRERDCYCNLIEPLFQQHKSVQKQQRKKRIAKHRSVVLKRGTKIDRKVFFLFSVIFPMFPTEIGDESQLVVHPRKSSSSPSSFASYS